MQARHFSGSGPTLQHGEFIADAAAQGVTYRKQGTR
jgi:hypothetical protein